MATKFNDPFERLVQASNTGKIRNCHAEGGHVSDRSHKMGGVTAQTRMTQAPDLISKGGRIKRGTGGVVDRIAPMPTFLNKGGRIKKGDGGALSGNPFPYLKKGGSVKKK